MSTSKDNEKETTIEVDNTFSTEEVETTELDESKAVDAKLDNLDIDFAYDLMSVPTVSKEEYRMVTYIILWARRNGINYEFDDYGNVYLTKGELLDGEYYPCVTSHLDTVQTKQKAYAQAGAPLEIKTRLVSNKHEMYIDGMGIGADCKTGVLISLSLFEHFDKIKGCFFLEEEIGMCGSAKLNKDWFNDVGYVIGWDSPDLNRAAWSCSGTKLMSKDFYENNIKEICNKHGLTKFHAEPFTDVKHIREKTNIICMNFGNGGYLAHSSSEYMILEDTDHALTMGIDLIKGLGNRRYELEFKEKSYAWVKKADGTYEKPKDDEDEKFFNKLNGYGSYGGYYDDDYYDDCYSGYGTSGYSKSSYASQSSAATKTPTIAKNSEMVELETLKYVTNRYEEHINVIKSKLNEKCKELGVDFDSLKDVFDVKITF